MNESICGANCAECPSREICPGCAKTNGCPFGKQCFVAKYILTGGMEHYQAFKKGLIEEINGLHIDGMETITELYPLVGSYVNLEYTLPSGNAVKFLDDHEIYLGAQVHNLFDDGQHSCFGVVARESFILVCTYGMDGTDPEIVVYKRR